LPRGCARDLPGRQSQTATSEPRRHPCDSADFAQGIPCRRIVLRRPSTNRRQPRDRLCSRSASPSHGQYAEYRVDDRCRDVCESDRRTFRCTLDELDRENMDEHHSKRRARDDRKPGVVPCRRSERDNPGPVTDFGAGGIRSVDAPPIAKKCVDVRWTAIEHGWGTGQIGKAVMFPPNAIWSRSPVN
jgi:hypothetical protein